MAEATPDPKLAWLVPFLNIWLERHAIKAAQSAGSLMFWSDGMLSDLKLVAKNEATPTTYKNLRKSLKSTLEPVDTAVEKLKAARETLAGSQLASQIDKLISDETFGKRQIRSNIDYLLHHVEDEPTRTSAAVAVCRMIEIFNSEVMKLHRMVYPK